MAWFDPNNNNNFDPAAFDYASEQTRLKQQAALARAMQQQQMPQGQMVSGHYVAPHWGSQLATALAKVHGAYQAGQINEDERQLNDKSLEALQYQLNNGPKARETYVPTNKPVEMGPPEPHAETPQGDVQTYAVPQPDIQVRDVNGGPLAGAISAKVNNALPPQQGPLSGAIAAQSQDQPAAPTQPGYGMSYQTEKAVAPPSQADQIAYLAKLARTGPLGQAIATQAINAQFSGKGEFDVVKGEDGQFMIFNKKTGEHQLLKQGNSDKPVQTIDTPTGLVNVYRDGTTAPAASRTGQQPVTKAQQEYTDKQADKTAESNRSIADGEQQLNDLLEGAALLTKVGTGRLQTPMNNMLAYITDSTDLDKLNRLFNQEKLEAAHRFLAGQGTVTDAERKLIAEGSFNPKASTQANLDYVNKLIGIYKRNLAIQKQKLAQTQSAQSSSGTQPAPARRQQVSESDLGGF